MNEFRLPQTKRGILLVTLLASQSLWAAAVGAPYELIKSLPSTPGSSLFANAQHSMALSAGEPSTSVALASGPFTLRSGYYSGDFGTGMPFQVSSYRVPRALLQKSWPMGVPLDAEVEIDFSDQLLGQVLPAGIQVVRTRNGMGQLLQESVAFHWAYNPVGQTLRLQPQGAWRGNSLYEIRLEGALQSIDGYPLLYSPPLLFSTVLDPKEDNQVSEPASTGLPGAPTLGTLSMRVHIPQDTLNDYAVVLFSEDPLSQPLAIQPHIVREADRKALAGSRYQRPVAYREILAFGLRGQRLLHLARPVEIAIHFQPSDPGRAFSLFALDEPHQRWVKLPQGQATSQKKEFVTSVNRWSLFSIMGVPVQSAAEAYPFPIPWRPHGPHAGEGSGQTGTLAGGITFNQLPSECEILIYTLHGEKVRALSHSDARGPLAQELWDVRNSSGDDVASGLYLWTVRSAEDSKSGKLLVIR